MTNVFVAGVGMTCFVKPSSSPSYIQMGAVAAREALRDAGIDYCDVQQAYVGYVYGDSTSGQAALYDIGLSGIPIINVNNICATGSTALFLARQAIASGAVDSVLDTRIVIRGQAMTTDFLDVVELHDCFTTNEILSYEGLRLTPEGSAARFISDGDNSYGGRVVTNPSGGLLSKGHPLGATGLAQCAELVWQLRGDAGARQVEGARIGLQHNLGLGGACVVTLYERSDAYGQPRV
jgi:acetyl-CoA acetyltransferase